MTEMPELLDCPFCGGPAWMQGGDAVCDDCAAVMPSADEWNARADFGDGWTNVMDALPEPQREVLVWTHLANGPFVAYHDGADWLINAYRAVERDVMYWRKLPPPPAAQEMTMKITDYLKQKVLGGSIGPNIVGELEIECMTGAANVGIYIVDAQTHRRLIDLGIVHLTVGSTVSLEGATIETRIDEGDDDDRDAKTD